MFANQTHDRLLNLNILRETEYTLLLLRHYLYQELNDNVQLIAQFDWTLRGIQNDMISQWVRESLQMCMSIA